MNRRYFCLSSMQINSGMLLNTSNCFFSNTHNTDSCNCEEQISGKEERSEATSATKLVEESKGQRKKKLWDSSSKMWVSKG